MQHCDHTCDGVAADLHLRARSLWLTTSVFSGIGCYEIATRNIHDELCSHFEIPANERGELIHFAVTDISPDAAVMLEMHGERTKALHRFTDVMDRCYPEDLVQLQAISEFKLEQGKIAEAQRRSNSMSRTVFNALIDKLGKELRDELCEVLKQCEFRFHLPCQHHPGQLCPVIPRVETAYRNSFWSEAGGHPCQPWSSLSHGSALWKIGSVRRRFLRLCTFTPPDSMNQTFWIWNVWRQLTMISWVASSQIRAVFWSRHLRGSIVWLIVRATAMSSLPLTWAFALIVPGDILTGIWVLQMMSATSWLCTWRYSRRSVSSHQMCSRRLLQKFAGENACVGQGLSCPRRPLTRSLRTWLMLKWVAILMKSTIHGTVTLRPTG